MVQLSILIPSIPNRFDKAVKLYNHCINIAKGKAVEIIMLTDNKIMTIGEKHNKLKDMCIGKFFMFIHDDDWLVDIEDIYKSTFLDIDVIDFKAKCKNSDDSTYIITQALGNNIEHNTSNGRYFDCNRPPFPNCAWHNKFKGFNFPSINYGEDWVWVEQCLNIAKTEYFIDKILFNYNFDIKESEASTKSNEYWSNPNGN